MAKIKLNVRATIKETFSAFLISRRTKGLAEKTLQRCQSQFGAVARHMDVKMDTAILQKADLDDRICQARDCSVSREHRPERAPLNKLFHDTIPLEL